MAMISRQCNFLRTSTEKGPVPFTYPEVAKDSPYGIKHIIEKPSLGIAISGGGFRAGTCATGWMRGLHQIELDDDTTALSKAKYLATTSGGSWLNAAFSYKISYSSATAAAAGRYYALHIHVTGAPQHCTMGFADGGCTDNLGVSALLRRKVKCLIIMSANSAPPDDTWQRYASEVNNVACFFGCATTTFTPDETATEWNDRNHLFGRTALQGEQLFRELFQDVHQKLRNGQPPFHRAQYYVRASKYHNLEASAEPVEVLWIFNQQWDAWEQQLPLETQQQLDKDRKGEINYNKWLRTKDLYRFPYFTTFSIDFQNGPMHMLSQLCTALIKALEVEVEAKKLITLASK